ncbi:anti-sigma-factor antagonist [Crinalium epipsammum PCC 9333]|uniref:Anti-sigma-factor antagonist n=1 Tax=Crinalium epipsammum PCC 9333 TaxID=1173022 RepID=K9W6L1_9CYAN|nr:STAS domain-containing protein [Crinalium epipsammum]AFZ15407.1 anti-sigma-factor antagonist [Crinalium epipsammum PCC 9333]
MSLNGKSIIPEILKNYQAGLLTGWMKEQAAAGLRRDNFIKETELRQQSTEFLSLLTDATQSGNLTNIQTSEWNRVREILTSISNSRARQGFSPRDIALFVFSFKQPLFEQLRQELAGNSDAIADEIWLATDLLDKLGLWTTEAYQKTREEVIMRQQEELLELSTPVVKLWEGILALPLIGTLDSARTQIVMESLLQKIVETGSEFAIIDITGVPTVDTLVAQHLLKTVAAARLMGTDCIISGIRPQIAQTIVHLGVDLSDVVTKGTLADAFVMALERTGFSISRA